MDLGSVTVRCSPNAAEKSGCGCNGHGGGGEPPVVKTLLAAALPKRGVNGNIKGGKTRIE